MEKSQIVTIRLPDKLVAKLDEMAKAINSEGELRCTRSSMLRRCILRGIRAIERKKKE